ncbi:MAG: hypothetical protein IPL46_27175 [Saprospiraceae bacterium]|nr:hypothetical protein [Saprospiraceae bacterium]
MRGFPFIISICLNLTTWAQPELSIIGSQELLQSDIYNPASFHQVGWHFAFPSLLYNVFHTGPGYQKLVKRNADGSNILQISALRPGLQDNNYLYSDLRLQSLKIKFGETHWSVGLDHEIIFHNSILYPRELVGLYLDGNQQFIGKTIQIGPVGQAYSLNSYGLNLAYRSDKITLGIKPRFLFGNHFANTSRSSALLTTSEDVYQISLSTDLRFDNVGLLSFDDANFLNYQILPLDRWRLITKNSGLALDFGINMDLSKNFNLALSVIDWGSIHWTDGIRSYVSRQTIQYNGIEVLDLFNKDQIDIGGALDSLTNIFVLMENESAIRFRLPTKYIATANYQLSPQWEVRLITYYQKDLDEALVLALQTSLSINQSLKLGSMISNRHDELNLGISAILNKPKWIGFFAIDQLLFGINPLASNHFNLRLGLNLHFSGTASFN